MLKKNYAELRAIAAELAEAGMHGTDAKAGHLFISFATKLTVAVKQSWASPHPPADRVALLAARDALRAEQRAWEAARPGAA